MVKTQDRELDIQEILRRRHLEYARNLADTTDTLIVPNIQISGISQQNLNRYLENPLNNFEDIAKIVNVLSRTSGVLKRNISYYSTMLTLNHSIFPTMTEKSPDKLSSSDFEDYIGAARAMEELDIKRYVPYFISQTMKNGYSLFYKIQDKNGVAYMEFPISMGRIYAIENGVYRWAINVDALSKIPQESLPSEIAGAMSVSDKTGEEWFDEKYFKLKDKGVAFTFDQNVIMNGGVAVSELVDLIGGALRLENARGKLEMKDTLDSIKLIHSKIPTDKEGIPQMDSKIATKYDKQMKRNLPNGIVAITNPMEVTNIPMNGSGDTKAYDSVNRATSSLFYDMGTPSSMFGGEVTSSNIVKISNVKDIAWAYSVILPLFESYYNSELASYKSKNGFKWKVRFIRQSFFTFEADFKIIEKQLSQGGSRLDFLAASGMSPLEVVGKLMLEQQAMNIDSIMIPKQTSYTLTGDSSSEGVGRPAAENPTDDTDRLNDAN